MTQNKTYAALASHGNDRGSDRDYERRVTAHENDHVRWRENYENDHQIQAVLGHGYASGRVSVNARHDGGGRPSQTFRTD